MPKAGQEAEVRGYRLCVCVDFFDDLLTGPFDPGRLAALFGIFRDAGMRRIYWIYTHLHAGGYMRCTPFGRIAENAEQTFRTMGEFLPAAVQTAHGLGMEIYAVYKPFDLAHNDTFPFGGERARRHGIGLRSLSGELFWGLRTLAPYAGMRMARRADDLPPDLDRRAITRIRLVGLDASPTRLRPEHLRLAVSRDNGRYEPYTGPVRFADRVEEGRRVVSLDGLHVVEPFLVIETPFRDGNATLRNSLTELAEVYDETGGQMPFTFGLVSRADRYSPDVAADARLTLWDETPMEGYCFNLPDFHAPERPHVAVDGRRGYLAFARGKERHVAGALSPAYPAVRDLWLSHVRECLEAGVDGVDLREAQHNRALAWEEYGFDPPVVEEYRRRHGETDPVHFDRERQIAIIADAYTEFYRQAAQLIRSCGRRVQLHVNLLSRRYMGLRWDWERWIESGLADEITLKNVWPGDSASLDRVAPLAASRGTPVYSCPWLVDQKGGADLERDLGDRLRAAAQGGREGGFILYESAYIAEVGPGLQPRPRVHEILRAIKMFAQENAA